MGDKATPGGEVAPAEKTPNRWCKCFHSDGSQLPNSRRGLQATMCPTEGELELLAALGERGIADKILDCAFLVKSSPSHVGIDNAAVLQRLCERHAECELSARRPL